MKKTAPVHPKHICICLDITNTDSLNQSESYPINELNPEQKSFKMETPEKRNNFIRLGSKRKTAKLEKKENNANETPKNLKTEFFTAMQPERKGSLTKYFQSTKRILTNSTKCNQSVNDVSSSCLFSDKNNKFCEDKRIKTEISSEKPALSKKLVFTSRKSELLGQNLLTNHNSNQNNIYESRKIHGHSKSRSNSCSLNKKIRNGDEKMKKKIEKIKEYKFVEEYLSDLEIEGILNELEITKIPEVQWPLIVVDKIYQLIRKKEFNEPHTQIIRKF